MERGRVVRSKVSEVPAKGRTTMGVVFAKPDKGDRILLVTTGQESEVDEAETPEIVDVEAGSQEASAPSDALGSDESDQSPQGDADANQE